jgi:hypothetical protein
LENSLGEMAFDAAGSGGVESLDRSRLPHLPGIDVAKIRHSQSDDIATLRRSKDSMLSQNLRRDGAVASDSKPVPTAFNSLQTIRFK